VSIHEVILVIAFLMIATAQSFIQWHLQKQIDRQSAQLRDQSEFIMHLMNKAERESKWPSMKI
jgi:hypothetical protein